MNQPASNQPVALPDQVATPTLRAATMLPMELLDACGNGYTAEDLARVLAARARAAGATERA